MGSRLEYHFPVRHAVLTTIAVCGLIALPAALVSSSSAQVNAPPVNSGFSGRSVTGAVQPPTGAVRPPTGTVPNVSPLGQNGFVPGRRFFSGGGSGLHEHHRHHHWDNMYGPSMVYGVPVPYAVDLGGAYDQGDQADDTDSDPDEQGGPTVFDRRGSGESSYVPPVSDIPRPHAAPGNAPPSESDSADSDPAPQAPTLLVFKDGHSLEVSNYAIVGATLFDLTPGHPRKVALASLDLDATAKRNDDRGVVFQLPPGTQGN